MAIYHFHVTQISRGKGQTAETLAFVEKHHISKLDDFQSVVTNLYNQVATLRKEIRELQAEFAKRVGIATSTVSEWKKKKTNPSADKIMDICVALEVTPEELLTGRGIDEENGFTEMESKDRSTPVDWQIIDDFHGMKEAQKRRLLKYMEALKQLEELEELE